LKITGVFIPFSRPQVIFIMGQKTYAFLRGVVTCYNNDNFFEALEHGHNTLNGLVLPSFG